MCILLPGTNLATDINFFAEYSTGIFGTTSVQSDGKSLQWGTEWGLSLYAYVVNPLQLVMAEISTSDLLLTF